MPRNARPPFSVGGLMLVCSSIDTICFTIHVDDETQNYMVDLQTGFGKLPEWLCHTSSGIVRYKFGLVSDGISIYYTDSKILRPNCFIRFSSEVIQREGYDKVYERLIKILNYLGVKRPGKYLKLSQVDVCFDFQQDFSKYLDDRSNFAIQTKLKDSSDRRQNDKVTYRLFGIGSTVGYKVRCYDKLSETKDVPGKLYWQSIWQAMGFSLEAPIWRVEYEIRRDFLKSWKVNSLRSFLRCQRAIQKRLFGLWNIKVRDDSNKSRCSFVPEFQFLIEHFTEDFRKHFVDKRPEEYERAGKLKMACAISALIAASVNFGAYSFIKNKDTELRQVKLGCLNNVLKEFSIYSSGEGSSEGSFADDVLSALRKKGFYFSPDIIDMRI